MVDNTQSKTIDEYIQTFPKDVQSVLEQMRQTIRRTVPKEAEETISYGIPCFKLNGKYVVYFAGWKRHISLYPILSGNEVLQKELEPYKSGRGTVKFPLDKPIPYDLVERVVKELVRNNMERRGY